MSSFYRFLKDNITTIIIFCLCPLIFIIGFWLYRLDLRAYIYPACLSMAIIISYGIYKGTKAIAKHKKLSLLSSLPDNIEAELESYTNLVDTDYRNIINAQYKLQSDKSQEFILKQEDMEDYYTTWVHQIKTPISSMRLKLEAQDDDNSRELLDELFRIEQYVEMALCYSRLDSKYTDYVFNEVSADHIIKGSVRKFASQFIRKGIKLIYTESDIKILTDEKWLSFVIEQLLSNALKYTQKGSISIAISKDFKLSIGDTGIGIAAEDIPRIFDRGYTGYNGRFDKKASGLGLYLAKRICDNLGHRISAQSTIGKGTVITIDLDNSYKSVSFE